MQARLQVNRFPRLFAIVLFALTAAMVLGGALGYTLRTSGAAPEPSHSIVQQPAPDEAIPNSHRSGWVESHQPS
ncbi:MAG TPA: hypothetical protein VGR61_03980 [Candidatus Dormibacteraeota bacterium]|nr:hypothetical protein [Candidatus Dormibacteraeota bacterium]